MMHEMTIASLGLDKESKTPILFLHSVDSVDEADRKELAIWIGVMEASSIVFALQGIDFERPLTHDLFRNFLLDIAFSIAKIEVTDIIDNTFYAKIYFVSNEREFCVDARPSDAIAMALRFNAPIYVSEVVLGKAHAGSKIDIKKVEVADNSEEGKKWADYLANMTPDEFGKYKV